MQWRLGLGLVCWCWEINVYIVNFFCLVFCSSLIKSRWCSSLMGCTRFRRSCHTATTPSATARLTCPQTWARNQVKSLLQWNTVKHRSCSVLKCFFVNESLRDGYQFISCINLSLCYLTSFFYRWMPVFPSIKLSVLDWLLDLKKKHSPT